jgi:hypothetical protein
MLIGTVSQAVMSQLVYDTLVGAPAWVTESEMVWTVWERGARRGAPGDVGAPKLARGGLDLDPGAPGPLPHPSPTIFFR